MVYRLFIKFYLLLFFIFACGTVCSQELKWRILPNAPSLGVQFQDLNFINQSTGWLCGNGIWKTTNGGVSWVAQSSYATGGIGGRCILFLDSLSGFTGHFQPIPGENGILYKSTNSGFNWSSVTLPFNVSGKGLCGILNAGSNVLYSCGRWAGPVTVIKSVNAGASWDLLNTGNLATGLIDLYFFSPDSGFVVGGSGNFNNGEVRPVVLFTSDGGSSWATVYTGTRQNEWCWKIDFSSRDTGFVSVERLDSNQSIFIRTTNGGLSWNEISAPSTDMEGIKFLNYNTGWVGGIPGYKTTNSGVNWEKDSLLIGINRFRFLSDTLGYAAGIRIHKYSRDTVIGINSISENAAEYYSLSQNYPNPFNPVTKIRFYLPFAHSRNVKLTVFDVLGKEIIQLINGVLLPGGYEIEWDAANHPSGVYFYLLETGEYKETRKMALIR
jgi:photosystem II stability/assembly factor-like uncharacterized protein